MGNNEEYEYRIVIEWQKGDLLTLAMDWKNKNSRRDNAYWFFDSIKSAAENHLSIVLVVQRLCPGETVWARESKDNNVCSISLERQSIYNKEIRAKPL